MITATIVSIITASILTFYNYYRLNTLNFINITLTLTMLMLATIVFFFSFDKSSVHSAGIKDIENITDATFENIDILTTAKNSKNVENIEFEKDEKTQEKNNKLFNFSFYITLSISIILMIFLRLLNKEDFFKDFRNILYNIVVVKLIELYFIFVFKNNYKDDSIEDVRKEIIKKFKEV